MAERDLNTGSMEYFTHALAFDPVNGHTIHFYFACEETDPRAH